MENSHKGNHSDTTPGITQPPVEPVCRIPHLNNKQNKNANPIMSRQDYHLTQPCPSKEKQTNNNNKKTLSTNLTLCEAYTNHWTSLRKAETKSKEEFSLEAWEKKISNTVSYNNNNNNNNEKAEKYYTN